ncbi:MAG: hypothetical protein OZSIB_4338 [Candidatus Ozemobacter sibiricus]|jgi:hypothetical protein|uniref:Uncharacterized protein n=1 Tax=Candidatus Ozemobacter sibiricus TaxID=2268124 RepID=A0A367ZN76_9BACT|nr:MAG: hypothetical protein OZSIB_4338 [Candidatus Ozemobacter sibiricus]
MEKKRYSLQDIQKMARLSPAALQDLLQKNRDHLHIEILAGPSGKEEVWLDQEAVDRLLLLKQLGPKDPGKEESRSPVKAPTGQRGKVSPVEVSDLMIAALDRLARDMRTLKGILGDLLARHQQILRDLGRSQLENHHLHQEVEAMRQRQQALVQELQKYVETGENPEVDPEDRPAIN